MCESRFIRYLKGVVVGYSKPIQQFWSSSVRYIGRVSKFVVEMLQENELLVVSPSEIFLKY